MPNLASNLTPGTEYEDSTVRKAYFRLAQKYHPDKNPAESEKAKELFQELHNSYQRLREHVMLNLDVNKISGEEASLYQYLSLHNVIKLNNGSMTVNIENSRPISGKKL